MAMGVVRQITLAGIASTLATPLSSEVVPAQDDLILHVVNASGSPITVTITDPGTTPSGSAATNPTISVPATTGNVFARLPQSLAANTGLITVGFSSTTSVTAEWLTS